MKRSRQRDAILEVLCATKSHPSADWIYDKVRNSIPNISLGTVYRNLNVLSDNEEILKLDIGCDQSRYDGNPKPHDHFVCRTCQSVYDVCSDYNKDIDLDIGFNCEIDYHTLMYFGTCEKCISKK